MIDKYLALGIDLAQLGIRVADAARTDNLDDARKLLADARIKFQEGSDAWDEAGVASK